MEKIYKNNSSKQSGIYKITNTLNERFYIGSCKCFQVRFYQHENSLLKGIHKNPKLRNDFNKCLLRQEGNHDFIIFEVLEIVEGDKLLRTTVEQKYLDEIKDWERCYNIKKETVQKQGPWSFTPEETRKKKSIALKGRKVWNKGKQGIYKLGPMPEEIKRKISEANKGRKRTPEQCKRNGAAHKGKECSEETRQKISQANKGKKPTEETKKKMSKVKRGHKAGMTGKKHSEETKKKLSDAQKNISDETRKKMSRAAKNRKPISEETKKKLSDAQKKIGNRPPSRKGKKLSIETRKRMSLAAKNRKKRIKELVNE